MNGLCQKEALLKRIEIVCLLKGLFHNKNTENISKKRKKIRFFF